MFFYHIGNVLSAKGDNEGALIHLQKALAIQKVALLRFNLSCANTKYYTAQVYRRQGNRIKEQQLF